VTLRWPDTLPEPQADSMLDGGPQYTDTIDVLLGPTRNRLTKRNSYGTHEFEVWLSALETALFENWYNQVVALHNGEWYAPWVGNGAVLAFVDEYVLIPMGDGWRLQGVVVQTRTDQTLCDDHLSEVFGDVYRDDLVSPDIYISDLSSSEIYINNFPLDLIAQEPC